MGLTIKNKDVNIDDRIVHVRTGRQGFIKDIEKFVGVVWDDALRDELDWVPLEDLRKDDTWD